MRKTRSLLSYWSGNGKLQNLSKIPSKQRSQVIKQAQEVLTDYLHTTRALPFTYAESISKNSFYSLCELISKIDYDPPNIRKSFLKFLRYNPINEFVFFYESIGIDYVHVDGFLKPKVHFFSDDSSVLDAACKLAGFGFPWDKLGRLYVEEPFIFEKNGNPQLLCVRLSELRELGFSNQQVVGICLTFPYLLKGEATCEIDALLDDLKSVLIDFDLGSCVEENVDVWYEVCRKVKLFYDLGMEKGMVGRMMGKSKCIFVEYPEKAFVEKAEFFLRLGVGKADVGSLLLCKPQILGIELDNCVISLSGFLKHFGLRSKKLKSVQHRYKYVFGRHKMVNLPNALKALDLHEWFFDKIKFGNHRRLATYDLSSPDDGVDESYEENLEKIKSSRTVSYTIGKLNFFHGIGFGENSFTMKILADVHGSASDLQERFEYLLSEGIEFSKLCKMISRTPKILNQETNSLRGKLDFFRQDIGFPLEYLESFSAYFMYNLERRVRPRYKFHEWLIQQGWCKKKYTLASIIAVSEKGFLSQLSCIHPDAPQLWEQFLKRIRDHGFQNSVFESLSRESMAINTSS